MNSEYWSRLKPIAMNALDLPEEAQAAYIHDMCGDDVGRQSNEQFALCRFGFHFSISYEGFL